MFKMSFQNYSALLGVVYWMHDNNQEEFGNIFFSTQILEPQYLVLLMLYLDNASLEPNNYSKFSSEISMMHLRRDAQINESFQD
jgi:hypothetical protein